MPPKKAKRSKTSAAQAIVGVDAKTVDRRWRSVRGRRGGLRDFMNMPGDVIQEICLFLHPRDLLSLSHTTRAFHAYLLEKMSAGIWKYSLSQASDIPQCPSELIEPAWVTLLYSPTCTRCGKRRATDIYWSVLSRICATCRKDVFVVDSKVHTVLDNHQYRTLRIGLSSKLFVQIQGVTGFHTPCYFVPQLLDVLQAYEALPPPKYLHTTEFTNEWCERLARRAKFTSECKKWARAEQDAAAKEAERITMMRLMDVGARLRELGWEKEVDFLIEKEFEPLSYCKPLWQAKPLTDRVWQNLRSEVLVRMEDVKTQRLAHEVWVSWEKRWTILREAGKELLDRYFARHPEVTLYGLDIVELSLQKEFRRIMCEPPDVTVDKARFLALEGQMEAIVERWRARIDGQFRGLFTKAKITSAKNVDVLALATTVFSGCDWPYIRKGFPEVVDDVAVRAVDPEYQGKESYIKFVQGQYHDGSRYTGCAKSSLRAVKPNAAMQKIVKMCGKNPSTATAADMDALDVRFVSKGSSIQDWRAVMRDVTTSIGGEPQCRLANADELARHKSRELIALRKESVWTCAKCDQPCAPTTRDLVEKHLDAEHSVRAEDITEEDIQCNRMLASHALTRYKFYI